MGLKTPRPGQDRRALVAGRLIRTSRKDTATVTDGEPAPSKPLGFDYNDGGINNQKLALLGLFAAAREDQLEGQRRVYLPRVFNRSQRLEESTVEAFADVFHLGPVLDFASRWGVEIVDTPEVAYADRIEWAGWTYFGRGSGRFCLAGRTPASASLDMAADFVRSLRPRVLDSVLAQRVFNEVYAVRGIRTAVQLRIEEDWFHYASTHLKTAVKEKDEPYLPADTIIAKVKETLPDLGPTVYVTCDERFIFEPKWTISERVRAQTGVEIVWKSDVLSQSEFDGLTPLENSLIDFELARLSSVFVGNSRSTFANLVCFERHVHGYGGGGRDYVYNLPGARLGLRTDLGGHDSPWRACGLEAEML